MPEKRDGIGGLSHWHGKNLSRRAKKRPAKTSLTSIAKKGIRRSQRLFPPWSRIRAVSSLSDSQSNQNPTETVCPSQRFPGNVRKKIHPGFPSTDCLLLHNTNPLEFMRNKPQTPMRRQPIPLIPQPSVLCFSVGYRCSRPTPPKC
jgi:hypothetical protein